MNNPTLLESLKQKFGVVKGQGDWLRIPCPTCTLHNRKKMKRYVPAHGYTSNCFICGQRKNIADLLDGYYFPLPSGYTGPDNDVPEKVDPRSLVLPYSAAIPVNELTQNHPAVKFLRKDHLTDLDTYANIHKIVYVPYEGGMNFSNGSVYITSAEHLVFPVFYKNNMVGWQMRSVPGTFYGDQKKDIRYYHIFNKGKYLYNFDQANMYRRVVVVEGVKKALKLPYAVATLGSGLSREQLKLIQKWPEVVMMLDSDKGNNTQQRAREFVRNINLSGSCKAINIDLAKYDASSPDELTSERLQQIVEHEWNEKQRSR
jgi:hypothetical protein